MSVWKYCTLFDLFSDTFTQLLISEKVCTLSSTTFLQSIKSNQSALLFADNYYVYSDELLYGIYIFESNDDFLTEDKNITIENECVIPPIS